MAGDGEEAQPATRGELRKIGSLLEEVAGHVRVIAEGHGTLVERMNRLDVKVDRLDVKVDRLELAARALDVHVQGVENTLAEHGRRLERIEHHVGLNGAPSPARRAPARKPARKRPKK